MTEGKPCGYGCNPAPLHKTFSLLFSANNISLKAEGEWFTLLKDSLEIWTLPAVSGLTCKQDVAVILPRRKSFEGKGLSSQSNMVWAELISINSYGSHCIKQHPLYE